MRQLKDRNEEVQGELAGMEMINEQAAAQVEHLQKQVECANAEAANYKVAIANLTKQVDHLFAEKTEMSQAVLNGDAQAQEVLRQQQDSQMEVRFRMEQDLEMFKNRVNELTALLGARDREITEMQTNASDLKKRLDETSRAKDRVSLELREKVSELRDIGGSSQKGGTSEKEVQLRQQNDELSIEVNRLREEARKAREAAEAMSSSEGRQLEQENEELLRELQNCGQLIASLRSEVQVAKEERDSARGGSTGGSTGESTDPDGGYLVKSRSPTKAAAAPVVPVMPVHFGSGLHLEKLGKDSAMVAWQQGSEPGSTFEVHVKEEGQWDDSYTLVGRVEKGFVGGKAEHDVFTRLQEYMVQRTSTVHAVFCEFDKDRSGFIDAREFQAAMKKLGVPLSTREVGTVLCHVDEDHNGQIEYKELVHTVQRHMRAIQAAESGDPATLFVNVPKLAPGASQPLYFLS